MGRFFDVLKGLRIGGTDGVTSSQRLNAGNPIFLDQMSKRDLEELVLVQSAYGLQHANKGGIAFGSRSAVTTATVSDSITTVLQPQKEAVYDIVAVAMTNATGGDLTGNLILSDGSTAVQIVTGTVSSGSSATIYGPTDGSPIRVTSGLFLQALNTGSMTVTVAYHEVFGE
jgi:hypothetical protein